MASHRSIVLASSRTTKHLICSAIGILSLSCSRPEAGPPLAEKSPVFNTYHGVAVGDDYRWLEDFGDPQVQTWSEEQNEFTRSYLDAIPER